MKYKLIKHNFPGNIPLFELQFFSVSSDKWYNLSMDSNLKVIEQFCIDYNITLPEIESCNNHV